METMRTNRPHDWKIDGDQAEFDQYYWPLKKAYKGIGIVSVLEILEAIISNERENPTLKDQDYKKRLEVDEAILGKAIWDLEHS